jgi:hypothetical protein
MKQRSVYWIGIALLVGCGSDQTNSTSSTNSTNPNANPNAVMMSEPAPLYQLRDIDFDVDELEINASSTLFEASWDGQQASQYRVCRYSSQAPDSCEQLGKVVSESGQKNYKTLFELNRQHLISAEHLCFFVEFQTSSGTMQSEYDCFDHEDKQEAMGLDD